MKPKPNGEKGLIWNFKEEYQKQNRKSWWTRSPFASNCWAEDEDMKLQRKLREWNEGKEEVQEVHYGGSVEKNIWNITSIFLILMSSE